LKGESLRIFVPCFSGESRIDVSRRILNGDNEGEDDTGVLEVDVKVDVVVEFFRMSPTASALSCFVIVQLVPTLKVSFFGVLVDDLLPDFLLCLS